MDTVPFSEVHVWFARVKLARTQPEQRAVARAAPFYPSSGWRPVMEDAISVLTDAGARNTLLARLTVADGVNAATPNAAGLWTCSHCGDAFPAEEFGALRSMPRLAEPWDATTGRPVRSVVVDRRKPVVVAEDGETANLYILVRQNARHR